MLSMQSGPGKCIAFREGVYLTYLHSELHSARRAGIFTRFHFKQLRTVPEIY